VANTDERALIPRVVGRLKWAAVNYLGRPLTATELDTFTAYVMATIKHETAATFKPIRERGGSAYFTRLYNPRTAVGKQLGNLTDMDAVDFAGAGYVQITGRNNYQRVGGLLGLGDNLVKFPHMALHADVSLAITVDGMLNGWFTGMSMPKAFKRYGSDFEQWRRIVNGLDKAVLIAGYGRDYLAEGPEDVTIQPLTLDLLKAIGQSRQP
jgi:putative chitinase